MEVNEILRRYAAGERDFRGLELREAELINANLQGVNLSQADLRQ
ncbi:MAG: pentapeptide repeat-containing protein, partial [Merismopedia sp. SIO2A8]|nr:pentapeptide repeat-containing protein [Merismopedia sp. SIO2A8]